MADFFADLYRSEFFWTYMSFIIFTHVTAIVFLMLKGKFMPKDKEKEIFNFARKRNDADSETDIPKDN